MKTKIVRSKGYYRLVVDDKAINEKYKCEEPIVLGCITEFADAGQWRVEDYRLKKHLLPSPYLEEGVQIYIPKNEEERSFLVENLHVFKMCEENRTFFWPRFDGTLYEGGDHPCLTDKTIRHYHDTARFTFKKAFKLLQEQKEFWTNFDKDDLQLDEIRINNPYRQMTSSDISFHFFFKENQEKEGEKKRPSP